MITMPGCDGPVTQLWASSRPAQLEEAIPVIRDQESSKIGERRCRLGPPAHPGSLQAHLDNVLAAALDQAASNGQPSRLVTLTVAVPALLDELTVSTPPVSQVWPLVKTIASSGVAVT